MRLAKLVAWLLLAAPGVWLAMQVVADTPGPGALGADPVEYVVRFLGEWGLRFLLASLLVTSVARRLRVPRMLQLRRLVGLFAFAYLSTHLAAYVTLYIGGSPAELAEDIFERPYITVGFLGWLLLTPLAATSTRRARIRLGPAWKRLHRLVYVALGAGLLHLLWLTKDGYGELVLYALCAAGLAVERGLAARRSRG